MQISLALHIVGIVFWVGGLLILTRFAQIFSQPGDANEKSRAVLRKSWWLYVIHGVGFTLLTGFYQLYSGGIGNYMKQGWFHTKLTFVLLIAVATIMFGLQMAKISRSEAVSSKSLRIIQILAAVSFVVIVFVTKVRF